jgi:hypothetical protein
LYSPETVKEGTSRRMRRVRLYWYMNGRVEKCT